MASQNTNTPLIKICGITREEDAVYASNSGADFLGFIFVKNTPRYISPEEAAQISRKVTQPKYVGVFMNDEADLINKISQTANLSYIQLHGDESPEFCAMIKLPVIKAFRIKPGMSEDDIISLLSPYKNVAEYVLLDAWDANAAGGTGLRFDWNSAAKIHASFKMFLAGGINPQNADEAVRLVQPAGVDVSSGVEESPGIKNHGKIKSLVEAVRKAR